MSGPFGTSGGGALTRAKPARYTCDDSGVDAALRNRQTRFLTDLRPPCEPVFLPLSRANFYREEFLRCRQCLEAQRELYSERAISEMERALTQVMSQLDRLCAEDRADQVVSHLLREFDLATGRTTWTDPRQVN